MSQSRIPMFLFALASLTGFLCDSTTEGQVYSSVPGATQRRAFPIPRSAGCPNSGSEERCRVAPHGTVGTRPQLWSRKGVTRKREKGKLFRGIMSQSRIPMFLFALAS